MINETDRASLPAGLLWIQRNISVQRDAKGSHGRFASMDGILRAVDAALLDLGIVRRWTTKPIETAQGVLLEITCTLTHAATGETIDASFAAPITIPESKSGRAVLSGEQAAGKVDTYGKRRSLLAALGLVEETSERPREVKSSAVPALDDRMARLVALAETVGGIDEVRTELAARLGSFSAWRGLSDQEFDQVIDDVKQALNAPL